MLTLNIWLSTIDIGTEKVEVTSWWQICPPHLIHPPPWWSGWAAANTQESFADLTPTPPPPNLTPHTLSQAGRLELNPRPPPGLWEDTVTLGHRRSARRWPSSEELKDENCQASIKSKKNKNDTAALYKNNYNFSCPSCKPFDWKKTHTFIGSCKAKLTFYFIIYLVIFFFFFICLIFPVYLFPFMMTFNKSWQESVYLSICREERRTRRKAKPAASSFFFHI